MSASQSAFQTRFVASRSWTVGTYRVTLTFHKPRRDSAAVVIEWAPHIPATLSGRELDQYRAGRDAAIAEIAEALGVRTVLVEL